MEYCPFCGHKNDLKGRYCENCGRDLIVDLSLQNENTDQSKAPGYRGYFINIIASSLVGVLIFPISGQYDFFKSTIPQDELRNITGQAIAIYAMVVWFMVYSIVDQTIKKRRAEFALLCISIYFTIWYSDFTDIRSDVNYNVFDFTNMFVIPCWQILIMFTAYNRVKTLS